MWRIIFLIHISLGFSFIYSFVITLLLQCKTEQRHVQRQHRTDERAASRVQTLGDAVQNVLFVVCDLHHMMS